MTTREDERKLTAALDMVGRKSEQYVERKMLENDKMTEIDPKLVEVAAMALCANEGAAWDATDFSETNNGCEPEEQRDYFREQARAVLSAVYPIIARAVASECAGIAERTGFHVMPDQLTDEVLKISAAIRAKYQEPKP